MLILAVRSQLQDQFAVNSLSLPSSPKSNGKVIKFRTEEGTIAQNKWIFFSSMVLGDNNICVRAQSTARDTDQKQLISFLLQTWS